MLTRFITLMVALLSLCSAALAETPPLSYAGVWAGTLSASKVQVCFEDARNSNYFYLRHKRGIQLSRREGDDPQRGWEEGAGLWQLNTPEGKTLQGIWTNSKTQEKLPVQLQWMAPLDKTGCGTAFYAPLISTMKVKTGELKFGDKVLKSITTETGTAFEIPDTTPHSAKLNAFIKNWLEQGVVDAYQCKVRGGEDWQKTIEPVWWTAHWLVLKDWMPDTYCGGAHGNWSIEFLTFDLNTGKFQDPWTWVSTKAGLDKLRSWGNQDEKPVGLRRLIEKRNPRDDCDALFWLGQPYPTAKGMVFPTSYSHAARACDDEVVIPYKDLMPFLTPAGKAAVQSILAGE